MHNGAFVNEKVWWSMSASVSVPVRGCDLILSTGTMARQAGGSVLASWGDTAILATVCSTKGAPDQSFLPLQVHYVEKFYAVGKIPGGFIKREGRPREREILVSRMIDRSIRPLFPKGFTDEVQVMVTTMSSAPDYPPDAIAMIAASAAVYASGIPWGGPFAAVRLSRIDDAFVVHPTYEELTKGDLDLVIAGTASAITMVEGNAKEVSEDVMLEAVEAGHAVIKEICAAQLAFAEKISRKVTEFIPPAIDASLETKVKTTYRAALTEAVQVEGKLARDKAVGALCDKVVSDLCQEDDPSSKEKIVRTLFHQLEDDVVRSMILVDGRRIDGREMTTIRPIDIQLGCLPRGHGSVLFTRGETQALGVVTLGNDHDQQRFDDIDGNTLSRFMLHYNFPPFSVGETGRVGAVGRREIGHGKLAEKSLLPFIPPKDEFPYTLRIVSEILESNGSSSMATVCASSLAMMDAGVPFKSHVAGISLGLVIDPSSGRYAILTDIQGQEDHLGDMDFKIAGTRKGITGFQLDVKVEGISVDIMREALAQGREGRLQIIDIMEKELPGPRPELSPHAPRVICFSIGSDRVKDVIGPGGRTIRDITLRTGVEVDFDDDGGVTIHSRDEEAAIKAYDIIRALSSDPEIGKIYEGVVARVVEFGAFVEILPGRQGLCHVSRLRKSGLPRKRSSQGGERFPHASDFVEVGDTLKVKVGGVNRGKISLDLADAPPSSHDDERPSYDDDSRGDGGPRRRGNYNNNRRGGSGDFGDRDSRPRDDFGGGDSRRRGGSGDFGDRDSRPREGFGGGDSRRRGGSGDFGDRDSRPRDDFGGGDSRRRGGSGDFGDRDSRPREGFGGGDSRRRGGSGDFGDRDSRPRDDFGDGDNQSSSRDGDFGAEDGTRN